MRQEAARATPQDLERSDAERSDSDRPDPSDAPVRPAPLRPRDAATLILLDRSRKRLKVLMGRRHAGLAFMGGKFVFPGGRIEPSDRQMPVAGALSQRADDALRAKLPRAPTISADPSRWPRSARPTRRPVSSSAPAITGRRSRRRRGRGRRFARRA
ncbi:hypothetical protein GCM10025880_53890 [Methylorubrum aminovorans]|nr:hypothetical protein GCM10025880_53890 [Methylorubrum aminovorans]